MNPAPTPPDPQRPRRVSVRHRGAESDTATSSAAETAIREALERRHRRRSGLASPPRASAANSRGQAGGRQPARRAPPAVPRAWTAVRVIAFVGVVVVLWQAVAGFTGGRRVAGTDSAGCDISGRVMFDGRPLVQAVLEMHPLDAGTGAAPVSVETDDKGAFARPASHGLAAGRYAVVVRSGCVMPRPDAEVGTPVTIPPRYTRPDSTPLQVAVAPAARLDLVIAR